MKEIHQANVGLELPFQVSKHHCGLLAELLRLDRLLSKHFVKMRKLGRTALGDAIGGGIIEEGEADGLLQSLQASHVAVPRETEIADGGISPLEPLERARQVYGLLPVERDLLLLGLSVEIDIRYARLVGFLNDHVNMSRPTLGLALSVLESDQEPTRSELLHRLVKEGPLIRFGLIHLEGETPLSTRFLSVPHSFWPRLIGLDAPPIFPVHPLEKDALNRLELPDSLRQHAGNAQRWAERQPAGRILVLITGKEESGREALAKGVLSGLCPNAIVVEGAALDAVEKISALEREARWHEAGVIVLNPGRMTPAMRAQLQDRLTVPLVFVSALDGNEPILDESRRSTVQLIVEERDLNSKTRLWNRLTGANQFIDGHDLAARFHFGPRRILNAVRLSRSRAESEGRNEARQTDLELACRRLQETQFGSLAQKLPCPFDQSDIVLPAKTLAELDLIAAWAKHGPDLFSGTGPGAQLRTGHGLACLFSGPPGTGKTMAAQVIARRINFDVYRIDLSQVVNKYIGETEKNLSRILDEAQRSKVILFFDEADALFGRRSEVKDAHDRYANIEVGYLLQRLETHEGVAILATNLPKNLDEAFLRRLQIVAEFPIPEAPERRRIWERLLPSKEAWDGEMDLEILSRRFEIAGGDIRNAVFAAHLLAAEDNSPLTMRHVVLGLWREMQKSGRIVDLAHFGVWQREIHVAIEERSQRSGATLNGRRAGVSRSNGEMGN